MTTDAAKLLEANWFWVKTDCSQPRANSWPQAKLNSGLIMFTVKSTAGTFLFCAGECDSGEQL